MLESDSALGQTNFFLMFPDEYFQVSSENNLYLTAW